MNDTCFSDNTIEAYLHHVIGGKSLGALAEFERNHRSTHMRRVRRIEEMRDNPDFDAIIERMAYYFREHPFELGERVTREFICSSFRMVLDDFQSWFHESAVTLKKRHCHLIIGDLPNAAVITPIGENTPIDRNIALVAIAMGWLTPKGRVDTPARKYVATEAMLECAASGAIKSAPIPRSPSWGRNKPYISAQTPLELAISRRTQNLITSHHIVLGQKFHEMFVMRETGMAGQYAQFAASIPPMTLEILVEVCGKNTGFEALESKLGLPSRSAKALAVFALDVFEHAQKSQ